MSDTDSPRPGRISGEDRDGADLELATDRGTHERRPGHSGPRRAVGSRNKSDSRAPGVRAGHRPDGARQQDTGNTHVEEEANASSTLGLEHPRLEPYRLQREERLRHRVAFGLLSLLGLVLLTALIGIVLVTMTGHDASSLSGFASDTLGRLFPLVTLVVGYIFGLQSKKEGTKS
jgi:hypothetical protein